MDGGSFRDLARDANARGNGNAPVGGVPGGRRPVGGPRAGPPNDPSAVSNYATFHASDTGVTSLLRTSDRIEQSKKQLADSEQVAKHVLVDLELQRSQLQDMKGMVTETTSMTTEARSLLQRIADRSYRRKLCLWMIIVILTLTDIAVFFLLFVR